jgi:hypothetical protein
MTQTDLSCLKDDLITSKIRCPCPRDGATKGYYQPEFLSSTVLVIGQFGSLIQEKAVLHDL